jgi:hypothetical protein
MILNVNSKSIIDIMTKMHGIDLFLTMDKPPLKLTANFNKNSFQLKFEFHNHIIQCTKTIFSIIDKNDNLLYKTSFKRFFSDDSILESVYVAYKSTYNNWISIPIEGIEGHMSTNYN